MTQTPRTPGLLGRLPVKPVGQRFDIKYAHEYTPTGALPPPRYPVDVSGGITDWGMLCNGPDPTCTIAPNGVGNCSFAGYWHLRMALAAAGRLTEVWPTGDQVAGPYLEYDNGQDVGANLADLLLFLYQQSQQNTGGFFDMEEFAFAPVDHTDPLQVDAAMYAFKGVYSGINLLACNEQQFADGVPWQLDGSSPIGGHCVVKVMSEAPAKTETFGLDAWVTWGALQASTKQWTAACLDEAWVIITEEDAAAACLDIDALRADIDALGGTE